jgi:hypothetical protein
MKNQDDTITVTRAQLELIFVHWCNEAKETGSRFEDIELMNDSEIAEYSVECADYIIQKHNSLI